MPEEHDTIVNVALWGALAGFGGAVKYVATVIRSPVMITNKRFLALLLANAFISSFSGLMGGLLVTTLTDNRPWQYLSAGIFGYLGTQGLDIIMLALRKKIDPTSPISATIPVPPAADPTQH